MTEFTPSVGRTERIARADEWIQKVFAGKQTKGDEVGPYTDHLYEVAQLVDEHGGDEDQIIAALLHDIVEDTGGAPVLRTVRADYGDRVADIVDACTDSWVIDPKDKEAWWPRKVRYIGHISTGVAGAHLVCAADKVSNVSKSRRQYGRKGDALFKAFNGGSGRDGQLWYYRRVTEELVAAGSESGGLIDKLQALVDEWVREVEHGTDGPPIAPLYETWREAERLALPTIGPAPDRERD